MDDGSVAGPSPMICVYPWLQEIGQTQHDLLKLTKCSSTAKKLDHIGYEKNKSTKFSAQRHSPTCRAGKRRSANRFNKGSPQKGLGFCLIRHRACYGRDIFANGFCHPLRWFLPMSLQVLQNQPTPSWDAKKKVQIGCPETTCTRVPMASLARVLVPVAPSTRTLTQS